VSPYWFILLMGFTASHGVTITDGVNTGQEIPATVSAISWAPYMAGVWNLDESGASTRVNTGACGGTSSNCNLSRNGDTTNNTTYFRQGTASNVFDGTGDYLYCTNANCGSALGAASNGGLATGNISFGCWASENIGATAGEIGSIIGKHNGTYGYDLWLDYGTALSLYSIAKCQIDSWTTWLPSYATGLTLQRAPAITHYVCTFEDFTHTQTIYANGSTQIDFGVPGYSLSYYITANSSDFRIGSGANKGDFYGYADECFVYKGVLSARDVCRICSCGIDGSLCTCSMDNNWTNRGRWETDCGNCSLPTSCLTMPGVD
jgi:hypothetical protein